MILRSAEPLAGTFATLLCLVVGSSHAADLAEHFPWEQRQRTVRELAISACLPCHFPGVPSGTDLTGLICTIPPATLRIYLEQMMNERKMPPDPFFREEYRALLHSSGDAVNTDSATYKLCN